MPAHVMSALAAYPEFSCTGEYKPVPPGGVWPITHIFCAGKEETFNFLEDVLTEVMELFPSTYIHIGGDEATKTEWEKCELCQKRMTDEGLKDEHELQAYFIKRIEKFLNKNGRQLIGWDEILEGGLDPTATIMSWRGADPGIRAAKAGHDVVMSPTSHCYFDYYQGDPSLEPKAFGGNITLKKVYNFEPVPAELSAEEAKPTSGSVKELERLRDILYGEQARATEDRLGDLEKRLEKVRSQRQLSRKARQPVSTLVVLARHRGQRGRGVFRGHARARDRTGRGRASGADDGLAVAQRVQADPVHREHLVG